MTVFYGVNATSRDVSVPSVKIPRGEVAGRIQVAYDEYTLGSGSLTTSDSLRLMFIPKGARVHDIRIVAPDCGGSGAINVGWLASADAAEAANATGFFSALTVSSAATISNLDEVASAAGAMKQFSSAVQVVIVPSTNCTATSGTIKVAVYYVVS